MGSRTLEFVLRGDLGKKKPAVKTGVNQNAISSFEMKMAQRIRHWTRQPPPRVSSR